MKTIFILLLALILTTSLGAQGEGSDHCTFGTQVYDASCNSGACDAVSFDAPCSDCNYQLSLDWGSCSFTYGSCKFTARVIRLSDETTIRELGNWDNQDCGYNSGIFEASICLEEGVGYKLEVCFETCPGHTCDECRNCVAHARITHD